MLADVVQHADMRMRQLRNSASLALETLPEFRILGKMFGKNLNGDVTVEPLIAGPVDLTHSPSTKRGKNLIRPKPGARGQSHGAKLYTLCPIVGETINAILFFEGKVLAN